MRRKVFLPIVSLILFLQASLAQPTEYVLVTRVIDGDTIEVTRNGIEDTVRFIGIDTPETVHPTLGVQPFGEEASAFTKKWLEGQTVGLELDIEERDRYGRLLAYVWKGQELFNNSLLYYGLAQLSTFPPNVKYVDLFTETQEDARIRGVGMWQEPESNQDTESDPQRDVVLQCVNINTASYEELQRIIHIGPARARVIINMRPFSSVASLTRVSGIGASRIRDIQNQGLACV